MADGQVSQGKARDFHPKHPPHIRPLGSGWRRASGLCAPSPTGVRLVYGSCSSGQGFACSFLPTPPRGGSSCCSARGSRHQGPQRTFTSKSLPGSLSLTGYPASGLVEVRQSWRFAPCLAHTKKKAGGFPPGLGAPDRNRTGNLPLTRRVLCQLSYQGRYAARAGLGPALAATGAPGRLAASDPCRPGSSRSCA